MGNTKQLHQFWRHLSVAVNLDEDVCARLACVGHPLEYRATYAGVLILVEHRDARVRCRSFDVFASALWASIVDDDDLCDFGPDAGKHVLDVVKTAKAWNDDRDLARRRGSPFFCGGRDVHRRPLTTLWLGLGIG